MKMLKTIPTVCWLTMLSSALSLHAAVDGKGAEMPAKQVSIFQVPWQCPAAPAIGCGSHAKPILLQLEADPSVREAWLNRQGTRVAVVWNSEAKKKARREVEKILKKQQASKVSRAKESNALAEFNSG